jgi:uncharacterized protein YbdZ (MbtH family)
VPTTEDEDKTIYKVVVNGEEQYSIWPKDRDNALGWRDEGTFGLKAVCLEHIGKVWTDMRPLSLRRHMEEHARKMAEQPPEPPKVEAQADVDAEPRSKLPPIVEKLSQGDHPVTMIRYKDLADLKQAIERGTVLVKFTGTRGGTEIGISLDDASKAVDLTSDKIDLCGTLTLDYQPVKCLVTVDPETRSGVGHLEPIAA